MLKPSGLSRGDGKRPDGMTLIPWQGVKMSPGTSPLPTLSPTPTYTSRRRVQVVRRKGAASRKETKYAALDHSYTFIPLAFKTYGPINDKGTKFLQELGRRLRTISDEPRDSAFLRQRISITLQHFNAIAFSDTFTSASETELEA